MKLRTLTASQVNGLIARAVAEFESYGKNGSWAFQVQPVIEKLFAAVQREAIEEAAKAATNWIAHAYPVDDQ